MNTRMTQSYKFGALIEGLYQFHFRSRKGQLLVYMLTGFTALTYAVVNALVMGRPEPRVMLESVVLTAILLVGLSVAYVRRAIKSEVSASRKDRGKSEMTQDSSADKPAAPLGVNVERESDQSPRQRQFQTRQ
jgi:hypothetical protein